MELSRILEVPKGLWNVARSIMKGKSIWARSPQASTDLSPLLPLAASSRTWSTVSSLSIILCKMPPYHLSLGEALWVGIYTFLAEHIAICCECMSLTWRCIASQVKKRNRLPEVLIWLYHLEPDWNNVHPSADRITMYDLAAQIQDVITMRDTRCHTFPLCE